MSSPLGTGVDTVHVWAYPANGAAPIFLASNADSSYVTGTVLQVMGGETTGG